MLCNERALLIQITDHDSREATFTLHLFLTLLTPMTNRGQSKSIQLLKDEKRILRACLPQQVHIRRDERERLIKFGKIIGRAIEELITVVLPATF